MPHFTSGNKVTLNANKHFTQEERACLLCVGIKKDHMYEVEEYIPAPWCNLILKNIMSWWPADWFEVVR